MSTVPATEERPVPDEAARTQSRLYVVCPCALCGDHFVALARSVYQHNDRRAAVKGAMNERLGSRLIEEKSFSAES